MFVDADAASRRWEGLFSEIHDYWSRFEVIHVNFHDSEADRYDFSNEILMPRMRERRVDTLQSFTNSIGYLTFGNKFFMTMNEQQQRSFFSSIFNLPVWGITVGDDEMEEWTENPAITISTPALLETLPQLHTDVTHSSISNFALTSQSVVQELSNVILTKCETLQSLKLKSIECHVEDFNKQDSDESNGFEHEHQICSILRYLERSRAWSPRSPLLMTVYNKQDSDESNGILDPLFYAASGLDDFCASAKTHSVHSTLVSPTALRALFVERKDNYDLSLRGLGLTDSHVLAIVGSLSTGGTHLSTLKLESNPGITAQGYGALFNVINQANVIDHVSLCKWDERDESCVDEKSWEAKIRLVSGMNSKYDRLEYMTNGIFTSEECRLQWLERVADLKSRYDWDEEEWDAEHLNFIWYTLCQNPEMMMKT
jgi:hypothetical protein